MKKSKVLLITLILVFLLTLGACAGGGVVNSVNPPQLSQESSSEIMGGAQGGSSSSSALQTKSYALTITYVGAGSNTPSQYSQSYKVGDSYSVASPEVEGYTADKTVVSGTMGESDVNVTVTYTLNSYTLTITYVGAGSNTPEKYTDKVNYGASYSVTSPTIEGYDVDKAVVSGTMGNGDVNVTVTYKVKTYTLTITYVGAGTSTPSQSVNEYAYGESYLVATPSILGYVADNTAVSGTMGNVDVNVTVTFTPITYVVAYNYNGGVKGTNNPTSATYDVAFAPSSPTKAGYKFAGWQVSGVNTDTALYGSSSSQTKKVYSDLTYCYQTNSSDLDYNNSAYWTANVYFKNLVSEQGKTITLNAKWTCLDKISDANDACSVINSANGTLANSKIIEIANGVTGNFNLSFTYYQNAVVDETNLAYTNAYYRTGILGIGKYGDWSYYNWIRQDGFNWQSTNSIATITSPSSYSESNNYQEMFFGLAGNGYNSSSTKFANFVRNALVTYDIEGVKIGQVGGYLKITQTIKSLGSTYKNQSISIVYDVNLTDGILYNTGLDICILAEDADVSLENVNYEITADGYTYTANDSELYGTLVDNYKHYCPDNYWNGDFDFTISYNQSQSNYYSAWGDTCWRTAYVTFYEWGNTAERIVFRNDWHGELGPNTTKITFDNSSVRSMGEFASITSGKATSFGGNQVNELRLFRNATVTNRCIRVGNTVTIYQYISSPGESTITLFNAYKFTTTIKNLSFQIVGRASGITITYEDYASNAKVLAGSSLSGTTYGLSTYAFPNGAKNRVHMAIPFSVKAGTIVEYVGTEAYHWSVLELNKYLGTFDNLDHKGNILYDTTWIPSTTKSYVVSQDCYIAVNIRDNNNASLEGVDALALLKASFKITFVLDNNLNTNVKTLTTSMLPTNSTYGYTTYSGAFGENDTRCHMAIIPLVKKGTVITFNGGTTYNWSVLEMASERKILYDTTWLDPATTTTYTVSRDCYIAINLKLADGTSMGALDIRSILYNNIKIEGKCGIVTCEDVITHSATEEGDMQSINHRGFSATAPENTLAAYSVSKYQGFTKVECDINFTSDGYGVLLHDGSIDRTTGNTATGNIGSINFNTVRGYDFGAWKNATYANEQMPTVEEFLLQCKNLHLHPYLELKYGTKAQIQRLAMLVRRLGMEDNVTWISFDLNCLIYVRDVSPGARLGFLHGDINQDVINSANTLKTGQNEVFLDINYGAVDTVDEATSKVALCKQNDLPLEVWTVNDETTMKNVYTATSGYVTGFTSDNTIAEKVTFPTV